MTAAKIMVLIDDEGRINADAETLAKLKNKRFEFQEVGQTLTLEARPRKLHEIEDVEERMRAFEAFMQKIAHVGPSTLPENWDSRDSIYD